MKTKLTNKKRNKVGHQDLTRDIGVIYVALFAIFMLLSSRMVHADIIHTSAKNNASTAFPTLIAVGHGELTWFGLSIYRASLWTSNGEFQNVEDSLPLALTITYEKNITSNALVERTLKEWKHLGIFNEQDRNSWGKTLKQIWPDVKPGDSITTLVNNNRQTLFYYNGTLLKTLEHPALGTALLSIWLDPNTSEPDLRTKLIGQRES